MSFFLLLSTKEYILNVANQTVDGCNAIDFHNIENKILWKSMATVNCLV